MYVRILYYIYGGKIASLAVDIGLVLCNITYMYTYVHIIMLMFCSCFFFFFAVVGDQKGNGICGCNLSTLLCVRNVNFNAYLSLLCIQVQGRLRSRWWWGGEGDCYTLHVPCSALLWPNIYVCMYIIQCSFVGG